jgi:Chaperone of endosialidase
VLDFPSTPATGDTYTSGEVVWTWDGSKWISSGLLNSYLPISGGALTGPLVGTDATFSGDLQGTTAEFSGDLSGTFAAFTEVVTLEGADPNMGQLNVSDPTGTFGCYITSTRVGKYRWQIGLGDGAAETGNNVGSDFNLYAWDDGGTAYSYFNINRASGVGSFTYGLTVNGGATINNGMNTNGQLSFYTTGGGLGQASPGSSYFIAPEGNDCFLSFVVPNAIGANFGISSNSYLYYGGFSFGANQIWQMWTSRDFGNPACDYRIKTNIKPLGSTWELVKELRPISYQQKEFSHRNALKGTRPVLEADDRERWGFVAHELQDALGETAAHCPKDDPNHLQAPNMIMLVATLTKTIQEMQTRIEALEARL